MKNGGKLKRMKKKTENEWRVGMKSELIKTKKRN